MANEFSSVSLDSQNRPNRPTEPNTTPRRRGNGFLRALLLAILLAAGVAAVTLIPIPGETGETGAGYSVTLNAEDTVLFAPGNCQTLNWVVQGEVTVTLGGQRVDLSGTQAVCDGLPESGQLIVTLPDGTTRDFSIPVTYVMLHPLGWAAAFVIALALVFALTRPLRPVIRLLGRPIGALAGLALLIVLALLLLEGGLRLYFDQFGTERQRQLYVWDADQLAGAGESDEMLVQPAPFVGYLPNLDSVNQLGYRGETVVIPKPDGVYRIVAVGGSDTYGSGAPNGQTYPDALQRILRADYGYANVEVVNAGVPGWNSWHSLTNLAFRVLELDPDLIIVYHALSDAESRNAPETCYDGLQPFRGLPPDVGFRGLPPDVGFVGESSADPGPSTLWRFVAINQGWMTDPTNRAAAFDERWCASTGDSDSLQTIEANPPVYFERNLRSLAGIARAHTVDVMFSTWTHNMLPVWQMEAVAEHNALIEQVALETGSIFYDLDADFPVDPALWREPDGRYLNADGSQTQADLYAAFLDGVGLIPQP